MQIIFFLNFKKICIDHLTRMSETIHFYTHHIISVVNSLSLLSKQMVENHWLQFYD